MYFSTVWPGYEANIQYIALPLNGQHSSLLAVHVHYQLCPMSLLSSVAWRVLEEDRELQPCCKVAFISPAQETKHLHNSVYSVHVKSSNW